MIKVVLTGGESTGKTELARALADHYDAPLSGEYVREFAEQRGGRIAFGDHGAIAHGQMAVENAAIERATELVVLDTDLVSTVVFCDHYFGRCPVWIEEQACARAANLYLLLKPDIPWKADGVRDRGDRRDEMHALFREKLTELKLRFVEIDGAREERFARAVDAIDAIRLGEKSA